MPGESAEHFLRKYGERPGQAFGPLALCSRAPCWPTAPAEAGPQGYGASLGGEESRLPPEFHAEMNPAGSADDLEIDLVARLLGRDHVDQAIDRRHRLTVHLDDHVASRRPAFTFDRHLARRGLQTGLGGARAGPHRC